MKRTFAIFFLMLFLFNAGGYHALHWLLTVRAAQNLTAQIEREEYNPADEITLAIPMALPYGEMNPERNFEKMNGEFEFHGDKFKFVKQKFQNDTLFVVCIKNSLQKAVDGAIADYTASSNNTPSSSKQALQLLSKLFKDFQGSSSITLTFNWIAFTSPLRSDDRSSIMVQPQPVQSPPPEQLS